jgi:hypothetical protein
VGELRHDSDEALPQVCPRIVSSAIAAGNQSIDARPSRAAERLAGYAAGDQIDVIDTPDLKCLQELGGIPEITAPRQPREVGRVCLDRPWISVGSDQDVESRLLETERKSARATEEVHRRRARPVRQPGSHSRQIRRVGGGRMACRSARCASVMRYGGPARRMLLAVELKSPRRPADDSIDPMMVTLPATAAL